MFFLVDAFTDSPFLGNPAGVYILDDVSNVNSQKLQQIAEYFNWSEIAFISKTSSNQFKIRWFSPKDEAPLCGHATLAAAHVVFSKNLSKEKKIEFLYKDGSLFVEHNNDNIITMSFPIKPVVLCSKPPFKVRDLIGNFEYEAILKDDLVYLIVLKKPDDVKNAIPNSHAITQINARAVIITSKGFDNFDFCSRYFAPKVGLYEDPVCGSAHCRLSYFWSNLLGKNKLLAFQASKRTGILEIEVTDNDRVKLSGKATTVAEFLTHPS